jgi:hypothetical protein
VDKLKNTAASMREKARELLRRAEQIEAEEMRKIGRWAIAEYKSGRLAGTPLEAMITKEKKDAN